MVLNIITRRKAMNKSLGLFQVSRTHYRTVCDDTPHTVKRDMICSDRMRCEVLYQFFS